MAENKHKKIAQGYVASVQGPIVDIRFQSVDDVPGVYNTIEVTGVNKERVMLEVAEHLSGNIARCIALS